MRKRKLGLGALLVALATAAILAAPGGATRPNDSISCSLSSGSTLRWTPKTTSIDFQWLRSDNSPIAAGHINTGKGTGRDTFTTPVDAAFFDATYTKTFGIVLIGRVSCTA